MSNIFAQFYQELQDNADKLKNFNKFLLRVSQLFKKAIGPVKHLFLPDGIPISDLDQISPKTRFIFVGASPHFYGIQNHVQESKLKRQINLLLTKQLVTVSKLRDSSSKNKLIKSFEYLKSEQKDEQSDKFNKSFQKSQISQQKIWSILQSFDGNVLSSQQDDLLQESIEILPYEVDRNRLQDMYRPQLQKKRAIQLFYGKPKTTNAKISEITSNSSSSRILSPFNAKTNSKNVLSKHSVEDSLMVSRQTTVRQSFNIIQEEPKSPQILQSEQEDKDLEQNIKQNFKNHPKKMKFNTQNQAPALVLQNIRKDFAILSAQKSSQKLIKINPKSKSNLQQIKQRIQQQGKSSSTTQNQQRKSIIFPLLSKNTMNPASNIQQQLKQKAHTPKNAANLTRGSMMISQWDRRYTKMVFPHPELKTQALKNLSFKKQDDLRSGIINEKIKNIKPLQNISQLQEQTGLSRAELFQLHSKFKVLSKMTAISHGRLNIDQGIDFESFRKAAADLQLESKSFVMTIFNRLKGSHKKFMNWQSFLQAFLQLKSANLENKLDLFLKIIDTDGNGLLSWDEALDISRKSLKKFSKKQDLMTKNLAEYFTVLVFKALNKKHSEQIPLSQIRQAILNQGNDDRDLLALFCGVDHLYQ